MLPIDSIAIWEGFSERILTTVEEASHYLTKGWPGGRSAKSYSTACEACCAAFEDNATPDQVRAAIIKAPRDAGILAELKKEGSP